MNLATSLLDLPKPLIIAHRGDAVHAPENSLAAFRLALEAADLIETDLWLTADRVVVCHHDRTLDRTTDGDGAVPELTWNEVQQAQVCRSYCGRFDAAQYPDERVPTLAELLTLTPPDKGLALELKDPALAAPENASLLMDLIRPRIEAGSVLLLSFHLDLLAAAKRIEPGVWVGEITEFNPQPTFDGNGIGTSPQAMAANPHYMEMARARGLWVCPLDPAPEERLAWYLQLGVDAVLSHHPAQTRQALARLRH
jgi:glycerophosphoryl diester phosphodiesterase